MTLRSSIYLSGNKFKLWDVIKPHLQDGNRKILYEPFIGSGTVALNALHEELFEQCEGNDLAWWLVGLHNKIKDCTFLKDIVYENALYPSTEGGYLRLKSDYNKDLTDYPKLFNLMLRGTNNWVRFSGEEGKQKHNMSYGQRNRLDMPRMELHHKLSQDLQVTQGSFTKFLLNVLEQGNPEESTVYVDPPYMGTVATYTEGKGWSAQEDTILLDLVLQLTGKGFKVVMSNVFFNKGHTNQWLIDWCEDHKDKFEVYHLDRDYSNSSAFKYEGKKTDEVLIVSK